LRVSVYKVINGVIILYILTIILLPLFNEIVFSTNTQIWQCPYLRITGKPCPFCGITRDIKSIMCFIASLGNDNIYLLNKISLPLLLTIFIEVIIRFFILIKLSNIKVPYSLIIVDIIIHSFLLITLFMYIIIFFYNQL